MRKGIVATAIASILGMGNAYTCDMYGKTGIVQDNDLWIAPGDKIASDMDEARFNEIIDRVEEIYAPIFRARGKTLSVIRKWNDGTVNAYAQQSGNIWKISMFGGLARHNAITDDGFAAVVCHEAGHHIGGLPKKKTWRGSSWATNEGQADYFATSKCMRKYMEVDNNVVLMANVKVPAYAVTKCKANFTSAEDIAICKRGAMAGLSLADLFKVLRKLPKDLSFSTPDRNVVSKTNDKHPEPQCRLDTYFQGSLCEIDRYADVSNTDVNENVCNRVDGHTDGLRPLCWYKP